MAKKKETSKTDTKFEKFLPGEGNWKGRVNKTRQDRMQIEDRDRAVNAGRIRSFSQEHKPVTSGDWLALRKHQ